jgi:hypothetical protein
MSTSDEPSYRDSDDSCMHSDEDQMAGTEILEFECNTGSDQQARNEILGGAGRCARARKFRKRGPEESDYERIEEAVGLNEGVRSAVVPADYSPVVQGQIDTPAIPIRIPRGKKIR